VLANKSKDKFTTNFYLPDGSYGTLHTGNYTSREGDHANFIDGSYTVSGKSGNLYSGSGLNTASVTIPSQWTSSGVGTAIPATELGFGVTVIYTITGPTTVSPLTVEPTTIPARTVSGKVLSATTIAGTTVPGAVYPDATTLTTTSTMPPAETAETASASATTKKSGATHNWEGNPVLISLLCVIMVGIHLA
jgi:hypothetical protein